VKLGKPHAALAKDNRKTVERVSTNFGQAQDYTGLLQLIGDVCDAAASGADCYLTLGASRDKQSLLLTITQDGAKAYLSEFSLLGLAKVAETLL